MFQPCIVIPVYNHGPQIGPTIAALRHFQLPCLLINDGSNTETTQILSAIERAEEWVSVAALTVNSGKGVAFMHGLRIAKQRGFTHALQIDADGQHDSNDIPAMLALAEEHPTALISGAPQFDASIPKSRLYGRYITHFWVWIETLSFAIVDSMCGFRVYPVAASLALHAKSPVARRMDFDTDIMVRLHWAGTDVKFFPTRVHYPRDGVSHFRPLADNLRITRMHTLLVLGMLKRLPRMLRQKWRARRNTTQQRQVNTHPETGVTGSDSRHWWEMRESGSYYAISAFATAYKLLGRRAMYVMLYPVIGYFFCRNTAARRASVAYLQRLQRHSNHRAFASEPGHWQSFRHFMAFGRAQVDRLASWSGQLQRSDIHFPRRKMLLDQAASGRGAVILTCHMGNPDMCRALIDKKSGVRVNVLVFNDNAANINRVISDANPDATIELLQISEVGPQTGALLGEKIARGEMVIVAADRTSPAGGDSTVTADFLGKLAAFPSGAFVLASILECPVYLLFCLDEASGHTLYLERFADSLAAPRRERAALVARHVQRYADRLAYYCLKTPYQWFNFFDFWATQPHDAAAVPAATARRMSAHSLPTDHSQLSHRSALETQPQHDSPT